MNTDIELIEEGQEFTDRQQVFCVQYLYDLNQTAAARRAGYSETSARTIASELMAKPHIKARIASLMEQRNTKAMIDAVYVVERLKELADRCMQASPVMVFNPVTKSMEQKTDSNGAHVWEFDSNGANKAFELLGKHVAMFTDKTEFTNKVITVEVAEE